MKLTILERLISMAGVKNEGDILYIRIRKGLIEKLALTETEIKKYGVRSDPDGKTRWDIAMKPQEVEIELSEIEMNLITDYVIQLSKNHKLKDEHESLYTKFVEGKT